MSKIYMKFSFVVFSFLLTLAMMLVTSKPSRAAQITVNTVTSASYKSSCLGLLSCKYTTIYLSAEELVREVIAAIDPAARGTYFTDGELEKTFIEAKDNRTVAFASQSPDPTRAHEPAQCVNPLDPPNKVSCLDVIEYFLIEADKKKIVRPTKRFRLKFVFYEYDLYGEKNFNFGIGGFSGASSDESKPSRIEITDPNPVKSLVVNAGNRISELLSINLALGHLGGYIESTFSLVTKPLEHGERTYRGNYGTTNVYLSTESFSGTPTSEQTGFTFSGRIEEVQTPEGKNLIQFTGFNFYYGTPSRSQNSDDESTAGTSLVNVISPAPNLGYNFKVDPGKPYPLFEMSLSEFNKSRGAGFLNISRNSSSQQVNIIGALFVEEELEDIDFSIEELNASQFNFYWPFQNAQLSFDPRLLTVTPGGEVSSKKTSQKKKEKNNKGQLRGQNQMASYFFKISENDLLPGMADELLEVSIVDSSVVMIGGTETISAGKLAKRGLNFGIAAKKKGQKINIDPLKFTLRVSLAKPFYQKEESWTEDRAKLTGNKSNTLTNLFKYRVVHSLDGGADTFRVIEKESWFLPYSRPR